MSRAARLACLSGSQCGVEYELTKTVVSIGRSADCDIPVDDQFASRRHAEILRGEDAYQIHDLQSKNGVVIDGVFGGLSERREGGLRVDITTRQVFVDGELLAPPLSAKQFDLLWFLYQNRNRVVSKDEISDAVWSDELGDVSDANIDRMVSRVRSRPLRNPGTTVS